jgi:hypothetical protein
MVKYGYRYIIHTDYHLKAIKVAETGTIGDKSYKRFEYDARSDSISYVTSLPGEKELYFRGPPEDLPSIA